MVAEAHAIASRKGIEKYTAGFQSIRDFYAKEAEKSKTLEQFAKNAVDINLNARPQQSSSAIAYGIASGIGGTGAGVMAAADVEIKNAEARAKFEAERPQRMQAVGGMSQLKDTAQQMGESALAEAAKAEADIAYLSKHLIDDSDQSALFELLETEVSNPHITEGGNIMVRVKVSKKENVTISGLPAELDGSLLVSASSAGKQIGMGYYNAPGYKCSDLSRVGFKQNAQTEEIILSTNDFLRELPEEVTYEVKSYHLWKIEL